ncbi:hypothetical protein E8L99_07225 [Phreatobacter aquaticus]|uniref:SMODS-associating 2TM beta-strand rich effector domain-containing protein n=1 Tax=Phreatobacter aquaticus TaxID=2570229 RepID=A0A4D7QII0_9HYPH|nr:hypothetical protein [Phreatobacter aquaticus]QCK85573.1 hypothetical protein E8L99_07225 [Phreatobacter aquaticus]
MHWTDIAWAAIGGALTLLGRNALTAAFTDVARRISLSMWGIRMFDQYIGKYLIHPIWSGQWDVTWFVNSASFEESNTHTSTIYRCFNTIAIESTGTTPAGLKLRYGFIGRLSRDKTIVSGIWFDSRGNDGGYHGVYQLRMPGAGHAATGLWVGFSDTTDAINSGKLVWTKL